jgi:hypothetical protein
MHGKVDEYDVTGMNINRFQRFHSNVQYRANRVVESLGMVYKLHYPNRSMLSARNNKRSPIHERLLHQQHAYFKDVSGWEGADWYGTDVVCGTESARNDGSGNDGNGNGNGNNNNNTHIEHPLPKKPLMPFNRKINCHGTVKNGFTNGKKNTMLAATTWCWWTCLL